MDSSLCHLQGTFFLFDMLINHKRYTSLLPTESKTNIFATMKKILYILLFLFVCGKINAQSMVKEGSEYECFCIVYVIKNLDNAGYIQTPFHDDKETLLICDSGGNAIHFKNEMDLLLYMAKRGWNFVYTTQTNHLPSKGLQVTVKAHVMKKNIIDDLDALQDLFLIDIRSSKK